VKIVEFEGCNCVYAKDQPEYNPLPCLRMSDPHGQVVSCWQMTWRERLQCLVGGRVWLSVLTFGKPL